MINDLNNLNDQIKIAQEPTPLAPLAPIENNLNVDAIKNVQPLNSMGDVNSIIGQRDNPLSNPIVDPLFNDDDAMSLLMTFRKHQVNNIVTNLMKTGPQQFSHSYVPNNPDRNDILTEIPEHSGGIDTFIASGVKNNFTARLLYKADQSGVLGAMTFSPYATMSFVDKLFAPDATSDFKVDEWFADAKNREYLNSLSGQQGNRIIENWIRGDYKDIHHSEDFFTVVGSDIADNSYQDVLNNASAGTALFFGAAGAGADPLAWAGGETLVAGLGKTLYGAGRSAMAADAAAAGLKVTETSGLLGAAGRAASSGTAFSVVQESGLHGLDSHRTIEESVNNIASNLILNSLIAGGLHAAFKNRNLGTTRNVEVLPEEGGSGSTRPTGPDSPPPTLDQIDAEITSGLADKLHDDLGSFDSAPKTPKTDAAPQPDVDVTSDTSAPKTTSAMDAEFEMLSKFENAVRAKIDDIKAPDDFEVFLDNLFKSFEESNTAEAKAKLYGKPAAPKAPETTGGVISPDVVESPAQKAYLDKLFAEFEAANTPEARAKLYGEKKATEPLTRETLIKPDAPETPSEKVIYDNMFADFEKQLAEKPTAPLAKPEVAATPKVVEAAAPKVAEVTTPKVVTAKDVLSPAKSQLDAELKSMELTTKLVDILESLPEDGRSFLNNVLEKVQSVVDEYMANEASGTADWNKLVVDMNKELSAARQGATPEQIKTIDRLKYELDSDLVAQGGDLPTQTPDGDVLKEFEPPAGGTSSEVKGSDMPPIDKDYAAGPSGEHTSGYSDYFPYFGPNVERLPKIIDFINKYMTNSIGNWKLTVNSAQFTNNPQLAMFYQKFYNALLPSKGTAEGIAPRAIPFEAVDGLIRAKGKAMLAAIDDSFKEYIKLTDPSAASKFLTSEFAGKEMWSADLMKKYQAWNELLDFARLSKQSDILQLIDTISNPHMQKGADLGNLGLSDLLDTLNYKALGGTAAEAKAKLLAALKPIIDNDLHKFGQSRATLDEGLSMLPARYQGLEPQRRALGLMQTSVSLPKDMTANEFVAFYNAARNPDISKPWTLQEIIADWRQSRKGVVNPENPTITQLRDSFYNDMGGYVSEERIGAILNMKREGSISERLIRLDLSRTIRSTGRMIQNLELADQLTYYLREAISFDPKLKDSVGNLLDRYHRLNANERLRGEQQIGDASVNARLLNGNHADLAAWNIEALKILQENIERSAMEHQTGMGGAILTDAQKLQDSALVSKVFDDLRRRAGYESGGQSAEGGTASRNILAFTRNIFSSKSGVSNLQETLGVINAVALSPFKGDFRAILDNITTNIAKSKNRGALLDNIKFVEDGIGDVIINKTGEYDSTLSPDGQSINAPNFTGAQKVASVQENTIGNVIRKASLGEATNELNKNIALLSTIHQLTYKEGLIPQLAKAMELINEGHSYQEALRMTNVPEWYANTAMRYLDADDIKLLNDLITNDVSKEISTPRRFFLDSWMGEKKIRILDLPENATRDQKIAMENLGMLANDLATHEKMAMPTWGDDFFGANTIMKQISSFWFRLNTAIFNRAFIGQQNKTPLARFGYIATTAMIGMAISLIKAQLNGPQAVDRYFADMDENFPSFLIDKVGWAGTFGGVGEKGMNIISAIIAGKRDAGTNALESAPQGAIGTGLQGVQGLYQGLVTGETNRKNADASWKLMSAMGFANDTTTAQLLTRFGSATGVYGRENNMPDMKQFWYDKLGVPQPKETK